MWEGRAGRDHQPMLQLMPGSRCLCRLELFGSRFLSLQILSFVSMNDYAEG